MKQLALDHYGWLKLQTFQKLISSPRDHYKSDKKPKPFASMMGSPSPAVRVQCFDLKSEYDVKAHPNMLETSFTHMTTYAGETSKITLKQGLEQIAHMKAIAVSPVRNFTPPQKDMYALSSYQGSPQVVEEDQITINTA